MEKMKDNLREMRTELREIKDVLNELAAQTRILHLNSNIAESSNNIGEAPNKKLKEDDEGKVFMGRIGYDTNTEILKQYFETFGEVVDIVVPDDLIGKINGSGFIVFADPCVADLVVQRQHRIDGGMVKLRKESPREEKQRFPICSSTILIGRLTHTVTETDLSKYFQQFGNITHVRIHHDEVAQTSKGYGFINFDSKEAVDRVMGRGFHELHQRMLEVKRAIPEHTDSIS